MPVEDQCSGDRAFDDFVKALEGHVGAELASWHGRAALVQACGGDPGLALAVFYVAGEGSLQWMDERLPVLGGTTPRSCVANSARLARLQQALLRFQG